MTSSKGSLSHSVSGFSVGKKTAGLAGWLVLTFAAGGVGSLASADAGNFYAVLVKPSWAPPAWLFGPAWSVLYVLMALAAWIVWRDRGFRNARVPLALYIFQLVLNAFWTWLFFVWRLGAFSFVEILVLWVLIAALVPAFGRVNKRAAGLLFPYLGWVTYAAVLTFEVWRRNPSLLG
ncbi:MAG: tryptophan-rich sensory protein [Bacteroidota bacterium]|nr:tryptophan-rich sensory protein [Bacteroidota bacterium]